MGHLPQRVAAQRACLSLPTMMSMRLRRLWRRWSELTKVLRALIPMSCWAPQLRQIAQQGRSACIPLSPQAVVPAAGFAANCVDHDRRRVCCFCRRPLEDPPLSATLPAVGRCVGTAVFLRRLTSTQPIHPDQNTAILGPRPAVALREERLGPCRRRVSTPERTARHALAGGREQGSGRNRPCKSTNGS